MTAPDVPPSLQLVVEELQQRMSAAGVLFGDGQRPADAEEDGRWVVGWTDAGVHTAHTMAAPQGRLTAVLTAHCVSYSPEGARHAAQVLAVVLFGMSGVLVDGRQVQRPEQLSALPMSIDRDVKPPLYTQTVEWRLRTVPT